MGGKTLSQETVEKAKTILEQHPEGIAQYCFVRLLGYNSLSIIMSLTYVLPIYEETRGNTCKLFLGF